MFLGCQNTILFGNPIKRYELLDLSDSIISDQRLKPYGLFNKIELFNDNVTI